LIQEKQAYPSVAITAIVNPGNGPGSTVNPVYASWIVKLRDAGITVIGYDYTSYAARSLSSVEADVAAYKHMYDVNGVFLDEMSNKAGYQSYYSSITSYAHSEGFTLVVGNPGTDVPSSYLGTVDLLLIFENPYLPTTSRLQSITLGQGPSDFALMSYDVSPLATSDVSLMATYASYIYITNGQAPNPYANIPSYMSTLLSDVQSLNTPAQAAPPSTYTFTVKSVNSAGAAVTGMRVVIENEHRTVLENAFTQVSYVGTAGQSYVVCVENYGNLVFAHWDDGLTTSCRSFGLNGNLNLVATYKTVSS
jgi:hypothetical protein